MTTTYAEMERSLRWKKCLRHPDKCLVVALDCETGQYVQGCVQCVREGYNGPALGRNDPIAERKWDMTTREMATRNVQIQNLKVQEIRTMMDVGKATDNEILGFIQFCQGADANPYIREAYLIKYDERKPASIVLAIQWYVKRAASHPDYLGFQAGTLVNKGGAISEHKGAVVYPGEELFGGWCEVMVKGRAQPDRCEIMYSEYNRKQAMWLTHPATMTVNTAVRQAMRRALPDFYEAEDRAELPVAIEGEFTEVPPIPDAPPQGDSPWPHSPAPEPASIPPAGDYQKAPAPSERRFHTIAEFWDAIDKAGWERDAVTETLGGSLGRWLSLWMKERGGPATWDDAYAFLVEKLGVAE